MVDGCNLVLYDNWDYTGNRKQFSRTGPVGDFADRDVSAQLTGKCDNTSYLVMEHIWDQDNGGWGYLMGKRDKVDGLWDKHRHQDGQRYWKTGKQANQIIRINIPTENRREARLRHTLDIHGRRRYNKNDEPRLYIRRESEQTGRNGANSPEQLLRDRDDKGQPCPGGEAYWLNATDGMKNSIDARTRKAQVACVYRGKDGLKDLHSSLKGSGDIRKAMYNELVRKYCDRATRLNDRISSDTRNNQCKDVAETKTQQRSWCSIGDKIATDKTFCAKDELGTSLYEELAGKYCDANPDDPFCGCYNVVKNKCRGEEIDKEIKKLEDGRKPIEGVRYVWYGFDNKYEYLNIAQIEVYSDGVNIVKDIDGSKVTVGSQYNGTQYLKKQLFDGNYDTIYHSGLDVNITTIPKGEPINWETITGKKYSSRTMSKEKRYINASTGAEKSPSYRASIKNTNVDGCKTQCEKFDTCKSIIMYDDSCYLTSTTTTETIPYTTTRGGSIIQKKGGYNFVKIDLGKEYTVDEVKVFNRKSCGGCNDRWAGSYVKLLGSNGSLIKASERVVGDHKEGGVRVKTFFDNGVAAAKEKLNFPGCKTTVPIRRTLKNLPRKYSAALDGTDKCWGNVCASTGGDKYVPEGTIDSLCSKSMTICNVDLSTGDLENSDVTIEQKCGEQEGTPAPMSPPSSGEPSEPSDGSTEGTPAPMDSSGKSSSVPLTSTSTPTAVDGVATTEELEIYEEPAVQIGAVTTSIVSLSSCFMLLLVLAM